MLRKTQLTTRPCCRWSRFAVWFMSFSAGYFALFSVTPAKKLFYLLRNADCETPFPRHCARLPSPRPACGVANQIRVCNSGPPEECVLLSRLENPLEHRQPVRQRIDRPD